MTIINKIKTTAALIAAVGIMNSCSIDAPESSELLNVDSSNDTTDTSVIDDSSDSDVVNTECVTDTKTSCYDPKTLSDVEECIQSYDSDDGDDTVMDYAASRNIACTFWSDEINSVRDGICDDSMTNNDYNAESTDMCKSDKRENCANQNSIGDLENCLDSYDDETAACKWWSEQLNEIITDFCKTEQSDYDSSVVDETSDSDNYSIADNSETLDSEFDEVVDNETLDSDNYSVIDNEASDSDNYSVIDDETSDSDNYSVIDDETSDSDNYSVTDNSETLDSEFDEVVDNEFSDYDSSVVDETSDSDNYSVIDNEASDSDNYSVTNDETLDESIDDYVVDNETSDLDMIINSDEENFDDEIVDEDVIAGPDYANAVFYSTEDGVPCYGNSNCTIDPTLPLSLRVNTDDLTKFPMGGENCRYVGNNLADGEFMGLEGDKNGFIYSTEAVGVQPLDDEGNYRAVSGECTGSDDEKYTFTIPIKTE